MKFKIYMLPNLCFSLVTFIATAPVDTDTELQIFKLDGYSSNDEQYLTESNQNDRLKILEENFRRDLGLKSIELLDSSTLDIKSLPRCRIIKNGLYINRKKRYVIGGSPMSSDDISYKISKYSSRISRSTIDKEMQKAFDLWSKYTDLTFTPIHWGEADIEIRFEEGIHDNFFLLANIENSFDGSSGTLAHSYLDTSGTMQIHFDDDENWTINSHKGFNLRQVAIHEIGHALGLDHSEVRGSVMNEYYYKTKLGLDLHRDDIKGIQALYGKKTTLVPEETNEYNSRKDQLHTKFDNNDVDDEQVGGEEDNFNEDIHVASENSIEMNSFEKQLADLLELKLDFDSNRIFESERQNNSNHPTADNCCKQQSSEEESSHTGGLIDLIFKTAENSEGLDDDDDVKITIVIDSLLDGNENIVSDENVFDDMKKWFEDESDEDDGFAVMNGGIAISMW